MDTALADYDPPTKAELDAGLAALNDPASADIADAVWDEVLTGATHNLASSAGRRLRDAVDAARVLSGTAASATASTLVLDGDAVATDDYYTHNMIVITGGTGQGRYRERKRLFYPSFRTVCQRAQTGKDG